MVETKKHVSKKEKSHHYGKSKFLLGGIPTPLKNMSSSVPTEWKNNPHVPVTTNQKNRGKITMLWNKSTVHHHVY